QGDEGVKDLPRAPGDGIAGGVPAWWSPEGMRIEAAIDAVYLRAERPTLKEVFRQVRRDCYGSDLRPPSTKALRARITRALRERIADREGAKAASDRFRQVKAAPRTARPLHVVQIDHQGGC